VVSAIFLLVLSGAAIGVGVRYVRTARRMRSFQTTRGTVVAREVAVVPSGDLREGKWGKGGGYWPKVTYTYTVDGAAYTSDRSSYAFRGVKRSIAEQQLAAISDEVNVYYNPAAPQEAYLETNSPRLGTILVVGGSVGLAVALILLVG
jgi:Protein of unknown function (DUF3592)